MLLIVKRLFFFWISSFVIAILGFILLSFIMPRGNVFSAWFRMQDYHNQSPALYVMICCFFYGILASIFTNRFYRAEVAGRMLIIFLIVLGVIGLSCAPGGMIWILHDMQAGYFPDNWKYLVLKHGTTMGFNLGWIIIILSFPYNVFGIFVSYFLTQFGVEHFHDPKIIKEKPIAQDLLDVD